MKHPDFEAWFAARAVREAGAAMTAAALYNDYRSWLAHHRPTELPLSLMTFGTALGDCGIRRNGRTEGGQILRQGMRLQPWAPHEGAPLPQDPANDQLLPALDLLRRLQAAVIERGAVMIDAGGTIAAQIAAALAQAEAA